MKLPNGKTLQSTKRFQLALSTLPDEAREAHILPGLAHIYLISIGKLCDSRFEAIFSQHTMDVTKDEKRVLKVKREVMTVLWRVPPQRFYIPTHQSNNIHQVNGKENSIKYLHAAAFSPIKDT